MKLHSLIENLMDFGFYFVYKSAWNCQWKITLHYFHVVTTLRLQIYQSYSFFFAVNKLHSVCWFDKIVFFLLIKDYTNICFNHNALVVRIFMLLVEYSLFQVNENCKVDFYSLFCNVFDARSVLILSVAWLCGVRSNYFKFEFKCKILSIFREIFFSKIWIFFTLTKSKNIQNWGREKGGVGGGGSC